jgi:hypothetical protein
MKKHGLPENHYIRFIYTFSALLILVSCKPGADKLPHPIRIMAD